ncbi:MAG: NifU family protein [Kiritimatiellae bacterium]|nr:NifU family protein [Kiritimatiellia bacterium]MDW8457948.1 NifU family protein [Verrucomicrobiota bacterium]
MSTHIKITGELTSDPAVCLFHVENPIVEDWTVSFNSPEEAAGSELAERLFAVDGVVRVVISGPTISVTKNVMTPWPQMAGEIGAAIRAAYASGQPLIAESVIDRLKALPPEDIEPAVAELFEEHINPALAMHGGFVRLVKVEGRDVHVEMGGGCQGCAASKATMKFGVENAIRRVAPHVRHVIDVTDHAAGTNPYYR